MFLWQLEIATLMFEFWVLCACVPARPGATPGENVSLYAHALFGSV